MRDLMFDPDTLRVSAGDSITWTNGDIVPHTVTGEGVGDSGRIEAGETFTLVVRPTASNGDTIQYRCAYHALMKGVLLIGDRELETPSSVRSAPPRNSGTRLRPRE